jgi:glycosyltransferase involved in cell wall biosynthesis
MTGSGVKTDPWQSRLSIVIPAYNEEEGIGPTLTGLAARLPGAEIIVVDDGSDDRTAAIVGGFGNIVLLQHPFNRGYGAALKTGMSVASRDFTAWFDADNEHRVDDLVAMADRLAREQVAAVIGQRAAPGVSPLRNWGKIAIRLLARSLSSEGGKDLNCGLRVYRSDVISRYIPLLPNSFSASITSLIILLEQGYPLAFHDVVTNPRIGTSKVKVSDGFFALMLVLRVLMLFAPMRIFLRFGMILVAIATIYGLIIALLAGRGIPASAVGLALTGMLAALFGLMADQISQLRLAAYDRPIFRVVDRPGSEPVIRLEKAP